MLIKSTLKIQKLILLENKNIGHGIYNRLEMIYYYLSILHPLFVKEFL